MPEHMASKRKQAQDWDNEKKEGGYKVTYLLIRIQGHSTEKCRTLHLRVVLGKAARWEPQSVRRLSAWSLLSRFDERLALRLAHSRNPLVFPGHLQRRK